MIKGNNGDSFSLSIEGYQFPEIETERDADWLNIRVTVISDGQQWEFVDPCLMVAEYEMLANWLRLAGRQEQIDDAVSLENIIMLSKDTVGDEPCITVYFDWQNIRSYHDVPSPPWIDRDAANIEVVKRTYPLRLNDLEHVANALEEQLRQYPSRWRPDSGGDEIV